MQAVIVENPGGPEELAIGEVPTPEPSANELLIRVEAAAVNRADVFQREGRYPPPEGASEILGLDAAGRVEAVGEGVERFGPGDRVFGLLPGGGYAEYAVIHEDMAMRTPENLSSEEAAGIPEVFLTAYQALFWLGDFHAGDRVLIHAGASGVGTAAIQLARERAAETIITTSSGVKTEACTTLGADVAIDYETASFAEEVSRITGDAGVDLIIDFVGAPYWVSNVESLALDGRIVLLAMLGGSVVEEFRLSDLFQKRGRLITSTLRSRTRSYQIRLTREFAGSLLPRFEEGRLVPVIDRVFPWTEVAAAHRYMEANKNVGKIILTID
jgi:putative PIG3 family NAD(P)H quinone oxidoreductase